MDQRRRKFRLYVMEYVEGSVSDWISLLFSTLLPLFPINVFTFSCFWVPSLRFCNSALHYVSLARVAVYLFVIVSDSKQTKEKAKSCGILHSSSRIDTSASSGSDISTQPLDLYNHTLPPCPFPYLSISPHLENVFLCLRVLIALLLSE